MHSQPSPGRRPAGIAGGGLIKPREWLGLGVLCLLGASGWLVEAEWPGLPPGAARGGVHDLVMASAGCVLGGWRIARGRPPAGRSAQLALASVCLLGLPATLIQAVRGGVSELTIAASFALLPVAVVLLRPHFKGGGAGSPGTFGRLYAALMGLAGALFLLPFALPDGGRGASLEGLVVVGVISAAVASVWMHELLAGVTVVEAVVLCCVANGVFSLVVLGVRMVTDSAVSGSASGLGEDWSRHVLFVEAAKAMLFDLPQLGLLLWLMREVAPERLAVRVLVVPLLTASEGYALLYPAVTARSLLGSALLLAGAWKLLTGREAEEAPGLMLRE